MHKLCPSAAINAEEGRLGERVGGFESQDLVRLKPKKSIFVLSLIVLRLKSLSTLEGVDKPLHRLIETLTLDCRCLDNGPRTVLECRQSQRLGHLRCAHCALFDDGDGNGDGCE